MEARVEAAASKAALQNVLRDGYLWSQHPMQPHTSNTPHRPGRTARPAPIPALNHATPSQGQRQAHPAGPKAPLTWEDLFGQR